MNWFQTYSGKIVNLDEHPRLWPINIIDIAHALSLICRWSGHTRVHYSVAQHALTMSRQTEDTHLAMAMLLHDACEAYLNDMISPLKRRLREGKRASRYDTLEKKCQEVIAVEFGMRADAFEQKAVKLADLRMLMAEWRDLIPPLTGPPESLPLDISAWASSMPKPYPERVVPLAAVEAENMFLTRFYSLKQRMKK